MKTYCCSFILLRTIPLLIVQTAVQAEVLFELNFSHANVDYVVYAELSATDPAPITVHRVESPDGLIWRETDGDGNSGAYIWTNSFEGLLHNCTNGLWKLILNHGDAAAETNWFAVSASNFTAATFGDPKFTYPIQDSIITNNQPTVQWTGAPNLPELYVHVSNGDYSFYESDWPGSPTTSWTVPGPMPEDSYEAFVNYKHEDFKGVFTSTPTNAAGVALPDWTNTFGIASYDWVDFSVTNPPAPPPSDLGTAVDAYYLPWTTGGDADWFVQTDETYDGIHAAQSGDIGFEETSWIETTVTNEGMMQFWITIDADENDYLEVLVNGFPEIYLESWDDYWEPWDLYLNAGDTVRWVFHNDNDADESANAGFLDRVEFGDDELALAVDAPQWIWTTGGEDGWYAEMWGNSLNDIDNAVSGDVDPLGESWIETTAQGPGTLSFFWSLESMEDEVLIFEFNGTEHGRLENGLFWEPYELELPSGSNTLRWTFVNDGTEMSGPGYLDQVFFTPAGTVEPDYEADLSLRFSRIKVGNDASFYSVLPYFTDFAPTSSTIEVVSFNEICGGEHYVSWHNVFNTLQDVIDECEAGPWTIYYDRDTPQEKTFTFNVSLPTLTTNDLPPVTITSPVQDAVGVSPNPAYTWTGPTNYTSLRPFLYDEEHGGYIDVSHSMPATATSWTNAATAPEVTNRFFVTYYDHSYLDISLSEPLDSSSNPLSFWTEWTWLETQHRITYKVGGGFVPMPVTLLPPMLIGGELGLSFLSQSGATHVIECCTNLVSGLWLPVTNFTGDGTVLQLTLPPTNPAAFYRAESQ